MSDGETTHLRAMAHPLRLQILSLLTAAPMTAAEIARELDMNHANVGYHLRRLHSAGIIDRADDEIENRRGKGHAKRYRYDVDKHVDRERDPSTKAGTGWERQLLYSVMARELERRSVRVLHERRGHLTDAELWVSPQAWSAFLDAVETASDELHRAARPPREHGTAHVNATIALFELDDPQ